MLDSDLAEIYQVETRALNQAVNRNNERFPEDFMFKLNQTEWENLKSQNETSSLTSQNVILEDARGKHRKYLPFVFTEQGVAGLPGVLKSKTAAQVHVTIMRAFVAMRKLLQEDSLINHHLGKIEIKQIESDQKFERIFKALETKNDIPDQGIFFNGEVFDAYELRSKIIRSAKNSIVLIDNYINEDTLTHLSKKKKGVKAHLLTKNISKQLKLDLKKANEQYGNFVAKSFPLSHDRFLIIDGKEVYHLGASLKDLGKKWFAFSKMEAQSVESIMKEIEEVV